MSKWRQAKCFITAHGTLRTSRADLGELSPDATTWLLQATVGQRLEDLNVKPDMMPELAATSHTFWYDDPWFSNDLLIALLFHLSPNERALNKGVSKNGNLYWTFPPDYPDRMTAIRNELRARLE